MKALGFILRIAVLVALVVWLADRPGTAQIVWRDYVIETSAAVLAVVIAIFAYVCVLLHALWRFVWDSPRFWKLRRRIGKLEGGQEELARGFAALAGGQAVEAGSRAVKARKALGETPMTKLLQAQAAHLAGDEKTSLSLYESLTQDPATAILGYRGLISQAWRDGNYEAVQGLLTRIDEQKINMPWLHVVRFQLGARLGQWEVARRSLELARKLRALPKEQMDRSESALLLADAKNAMRVSDFPRALACAEKARKLAPDWVPASLVLAEAQMLSGYERAALRTIDKVWSKAPHIQFIQIIFWALRHGKPIEAFKFIEKMVRHDKESPLALLARSEAALRADLWGEARRALLLLDERHLATQSVYQMLARLERRELRDERAAAAWLGKAVSANPDPVWLCQTCGASHETWEASCPSCAAFNQMVWGTPGRGRERLVGSENISTDLLMHD